MFPLKKKVLYAFIAIAWSVLFFMLTPVILFFTGQNLKSSSIDLNINHDKVYYAIDELYVFDNLLTQVDIQGWAFVETKQDNPDKTVKLIFASNHDAYEVNTFLSERTDLVSAMEDKKVPANRNGISAMFSPLAMKNGDYSLYIYVYENEENYGIVNTGREFRKDYRSFTELKGGEKLLNADFANAAINEAVISNIESCKLDGEKLLVSGWAFLKDTDSSLNHIFIEVKKPDGTVSVYSTNRIPREDVGEFYKDARYKMSGFRAELSSNAIGEGDNIITVIVGTKNRSIQEYIYNWQEADE